MNKPFYLFFAVLMVVMNALSAKAQMSSPFLVEMIKNVNKYVGADVVEPSMLAPLASADKQKRERFITQYVGTDTLTGEFLLITAKPGGGFDTIRTENTLEVNFLNVRKLSGNSAYNGVWAPLYAFDSDMNDPRMWLIVSYKKSAGAVTDQGKAPTTGTTGDVVTLPDGTTLGPGYMRNADGTMLYKQDNGSYLTLEQMKEEARAEANQGAQQTTSTGSTTPTRYEPEVKYFQDEDGKSVPYYVSAEGQIMRLTDPNTPKQFDVDGVNVVYAMNENGVWQPTFTDKRNGYKFGVGEYAGYRANYYRDATNGAPLGTGNFRAVGGILPIGGGGYFAGGGGCFPGNGGAGCFPSSGPNWYNQLQAVSQPRVTGGMPQWTNYGPRFMNPNARRW